MRATDTAEVAQIATDDPTPTESSHVVATVQTVIAEQTFQKIVDDATATSAQATALVAQVGTESAIQTATATMWTDTPSRTSTPSPALVRTLDRTEVAQTITATPTVGLRVTATQQSIEQTSTASVWTDTPTSSNTPMTTPQITTPQGDVTPVVREEIGDSTVYIFHDDSVEAPNQTIVELQLFFDNIYITPTPVGPVTSVPVTQNATRPAIATPGEPTVTPRSAAYSESNIHIPKRLMGVLNCSAASFDGCGTNDVLVLEINGVNSWLWQLIPKEGVHGNQTLRLELRTLDENNEQDRRIWRYDFEIEIIGDGEEISSDIVGNIIMVVGGIIVALLGGFFGIWQLWLGERWKSDKLKKSEDKIATSSEKKVKVFISYRRKVSAGFGKTIHDALVARGVDVFIDVEDIHAGSFSDYIRKNIEERDFFIVLLAPETLESEWVVKEIMYAKEKGKTIIPVLVNDFDLYGSEVTKKLEFLQDQNAITMPLEHFHSAIEKIAKFIGLASDK